MENILIKVRSLYKKITFYFYEKIGNYFLANPIYIYIYIYINNQLIEYHNDMQISNVIIARFSKL